MKDGHLNPAFAEDSSYHVFTARSFLAAHKAGTL